MTKYKCIFKFKSHKKLELTSTRFSDFKDGFWITEEWLYTDDYSKWKFWIPSHQIHHIEKFEE